MPGATSIDAIGEMSSPCLDEHVVAIELAGGTSLLDERTGRIVPVSPTLALAAAMLDGRVMLSELAADVAAVFGVASTTTTSELVAATRDLAHLGMLAGEGSEWGEDGPSQPETPFLETASNH